MFVDQNRSMCHAMIQTLRDSNCIMKLFRNGTTTVGPYKPLDTDCWAERCKAWSDMLTGEGFVVAYQSEETDVVLDQRGRLTLTAEEAHTFSKASPEWFYVALPPRAAVRL